MRPAGRDNYPLQALFGKKVVVLQDLRYSSLRLGWDALLVWWEGKPVQIPMPRNIHAGTKMYNEKAGIFASSGSKLRIPLMEAATLQVDPAKQNKMMDKRFHYFFFGHEIQDDEVIEVEACGRCFSLWLQFGAEGAQRQREQQSPQWPSANPLAVQRESTSGPLQHNERQHPRWPSPHLVVEQRDHTSAMQQLGEHQRPEPRVASADHAQSAPASSRVRLDTCRRCQMQNAEVWMCSECSALVCETCAPPCGACGQRLCLGEPGVDCPGKHSPDSWECSDAMGTHYRLLRDLPITVAGRAYHEAQMVEASEADTHEPTDVQATAVHAIRHWLETHADAKASPEWMSRLAADVNWSTDFRATCGRLGQFVKKHAL